MSGAFKVNGKLVGAEAPPMERLSDFLRERLDLSGTKVGCNAGDCGACTVLLDGEPACACLVAVGQLEGVEVTTIEDSDASDTLQRLKDSFLRHGAVQCGICTPGMLMSALALLRKEPNPSEGQVRDALNGVLCRCTGYQKIVTAVRTALQETSAPASPPSPDALVGASVLNLDGPLKVEGRLAYGADAHPENTLLVRVIRSPYHHASFSIGDRDRFLAQHDGLLAVFDATDIPGKNCFGVIPAFADQPVFAEKHTRFRGEAVAMVVGEPDAVRSFDENEFPVSWQALDPLLTPDEAVSTSAGDLHQGRPGNVMAEGLVERGDAEAALDKSDHRVVVRTSTPQIEHAYIEPEAGYAEFSGDELVVHVSTQAPHMNREALEEILALERGKVRVVTTACGGGFGSKLDLSVQPYIALAALKLGRPVSLVYSRTESMQSTTKRHPSEIDVEAGCDKDGNITGFSFIGRFNTGAYASWGPTVANRVPVHASGPYYVPDYRAKSVAIHSNAPTSGAFRGFGVPQSAIAQELAFDKLADLVGADRLAFRLRNVLEDGMPTVTGQVFETGVGIRACLEALQGSWKAAGERARNFNQSQSDAGSPLRKGVGLASCWYGCGNTSLPNPSTMRIGVTKSGRLVLHQGATEIGQGSNTIITQIAAQALGVPMSSIDHARNDTTTTPDAGKTSASRQTFVSGKAVMRAAVSLREQILRHGNVSASSEITFGEGAILLSDGVAEVTLDLSSLEENACGYVFMAEETYDPPTEPLDEKGQGEPYAIYGYGAQLVELTVDTTLGTIRLDAIVAAHDVGRAINPMLVEGQIEGGVAQGIGLALMEDYQPGRTENLHDYLIPTIGDVPPINSIIVEVESPEGPFGAKGLGEHVLIPTAAAIVNAVWDAGGIEVPDLPITPDKVLAALNTKRP